MAELLKINSIFYVSGIKCWNITITVILEFSYLLFQKQ